MSGLTVSLDASAIARLGNMIAAAGPRAHDAIRRAINHTGDKARTQMVRTLTGQTGLKRKVIFRALKVNRANYGGAATAKTSAGLSYAIVSRGGDVSLKFFSPRETRGGVSAAPWKKRQVYAGTFTKGGRFPNRVPLQMGGHVLRRVGAGRTPLARAKSGLFIPREMVTGQTKAAFEQTVAAELPARLGHELARILGG